MLLSVLPGRCWALNENMAYWWIIRIPILLASLVGNSCQPRDCLDSSSSVPGSQSWAGLGSPGKIPAEARREIWPARSSQIHRGFSSLLVLGVHEGIWGAEPQRKGLGLAPAAS